MSNKFIGSSFDDYLKEEGIFKEVETKAIKHLHYDKYDNMQPGNLKMDLDPASEERRLNKQGLLSQRREQQEAR